ncbi:MAG: hypothetical protein JWQ09_1172 [Segetibacter sp.]|nr:hypothetical protein [Segetibacter sp.]
MSPQSILRKIALKFPFLLLMFALCTIIPVLYISNEHTIHSWDDEAYHDMTVYKALTLRESKLFSLSSLRQQISILYQSTEKNYSDYHTLFISPMILLFGASRMVYILSLAWFYLFPLVITIGAIASSIVPSNKTQAFRTACLIAVFTPSLWLPTLYGYPDAGAAFLICITVLLYLQNMELTSRWRLFVMGICLAVSVLFRRHYAYDVITFFVSISLMQIYLAVTSRQPTSIIIRKLLLSAVSVCLLGISMLGTLFILGWPFLKRLAHTNYSELYSSYERDSFVNIKEYLSYYGWLAILIALAGLCLAIFSKRNILKSREAALFILLAGCYSITQWIVKVKQTSIHYSLHFTPWIILGIFIAFWCSLSLSRQKKALLLLGFCSLWGFIFIATLFPVTGNSEHRSQLGVGSFILQAIPSNHAPAKRSDYQQILNLSSYLQSIATNKEPIYVVASSKLLNDDLIWRAHPNFHQIMMSFKSEDFWKGYKINVLHWAPFADSYDNYPLGEMMKAGFVVTTKPFQHHLPLEQQKVIYTVAKAFEEHWNYSRDFQLLPKTFTLADSVTVYIYKRIRPTAIPTMLATYKRIQEYFKSPPGGKTDWMGLNINNYYISLQPNIRTHDITVERIAGEPASLLYLEKKSSPIKSIKGNISFSSPRIKSFIICLTGIDEVGTTVFMEQQKLQTEKSEFDISLNSDRLDYSFLNLTIVPERFGDSVAQCKYITIKNLRMQK